MSISAAIAVVAKEVVVKAAVESAKEVALQATREVAQKIATDAAAQGAGKELQTAMMERQTMQDGFRTGEMPETKGEGREFAKQREADAAEELRGKLDDEGAQPEIAERYELTDAPNGEVQQPFEVTENIEAQGGEKIQEGIPRSGLDETSEGVEWRDATDVSETTEIFRKTIKEETGWSDDIVNSIRNDGEYGVYKNADLKEGMVNGRPSLQREIDPSFKDDFGRTNMERMQNGLSPYDAKSGEKLELHHMGQRADSPFAELRENLDHGDGNHRILHDMKTESWRREPGNVSDYATQRSDYWKTRATQLAA